jgi:cytosine/adenosine deaminase-related metal-dependent hydrolase
MSLQAYEASWLISGKPDEPPIKQGALVLDARGRVLSVGTAEALKRAYPGVAFRSERAVLLPGLVNAHVHLELSALRGETRSGGGFGPWVTSLMEKRERVLPEQDAEAIERGVSELLRAGTAAVGEVTNTLAAVDALATAPLIGRVFHEVFGMRREVAQIMRQAAEQARAARAEFPDNLSYTLAPHTLYSLHPQSARELCAGGRTSLHLAEHAAERAFLRDGTGPFAEFLRARNVAPADWDPPGLSPVHYADALGLLSPELLAVHLCATSKDELALVKQRGAQVVLCPRSNLFIELKLPPLFDMMALGMEPALGTDSLASNTSLDVLAEAAALHDRFPQLKALEFVSMATWYGARALGLSDRVGALAPGLAPGVLAVDLADPEIDPLKVLLRSPPPSRRVLVRPGLSCSPAEPRASTSCSPAEPRASTPGSADPLR